MKNDNLAYEAFDRFHSVEAVASKIFDELPELQSDGQTGDHAQSARDVTRGATGPAVDNAGDTSILAKTERLLTSLLVALDERHRDTRPGFPTPDSTEGSPKPKLVPLADVSYHAARRRAQLPDGIEILSGAPNRPADDVILQSIREMIDDQEEEFEKVRIEEKRAFNRKVLPSLEAQDVLSPDADRTGASGAPASLRSRVREQLQVWFRGYYFLCFTLSGWSTLALMVFIDPALSGTLCVFSMFLLFVSYCLFSDRTDAQAQNA